MRTAVLSLCRDRIDYSRHCFATLREHAGIPYDHWVLDQGSTDGTADWLPTQPLTHVVLADRNMGISRGLNHLLDLIRDEAYDVVVKVDNDCELTQPGTLATVCDLLDENMVLSPRVLGLREPPVPRRIIQHRGTEVGLLNHVGGIFLATRASTYERFRYSESNPSWGMDDVQIGQCVNSWGGIVGYVMNLTVSHFEGTDGQWARYPDYFARKRAEGLP